MADPINWTKFAADFGAGLTKQQLEGIYDNLMQTELGRRALALSKTNRLLLSLSFLAAGSLVDQKIKEDSAWKRFLKNVLADAPSEVGSRLTKGASAQFVDREAGPTLIAEQNRTGQRLLELEKTELDALLGWLKEMSPEDRDRFRGLLAGLSASELQKLAGLSQEQKDTMMSFLNPLKQENPLLQEVANDLRRARLAVEEKLRQRRERRSLKS